MAKKTFWTQDHSGKLYKNAHILLSRVKYRSECHFLFLQAVYGLLWVPVLCLSFPLVPVRGRLGSPAGPQLGGWRGSSHERLCSPRGLVGVLLAEAACPTVDQDPRSRSLPRRGPPGRRGDRGTPAALRCAQIIGWCQQTHALPHPALFPALWGLTGPGSGTAAELHRVCPSRPGVRPPRFGFSAPGQGHPCTVAEMPQGLAYCPAK